jgi:FkbM family methyltransferase
VIGFEPDEQECQRINKHHSSGIPNAICFPVALGQKHQTDAKLYICKALGCSSLYEPNHEFVKEFYWGPNMDVIASKRLTLTTLQNVCENNGIVPDTIKIDTQGSEIDILKGAHKVLNHVKLIELEVEFNPQYKKQPLFADIDMFLRSKGFLLLGLRRTCWRRFSKYNLTVPFGGQIMHGDAIYYNHRFLNESQFYTTKDVLKFCVILSAYKQYDFIAYLLSKPHNGLKEISDGDRRKLFSALLYSPGRVFYLISRLLDLVRKRLWLPHVKLRSILDNLQSQKAVDWHDPDFF